MINKDLLLLLKGKLYDGWCWWRLYSRLPQRIWYHNGIPTGINANMGTGRAGALYCNFEAAIWQSPLMAFLGELFSIKQWLICYILIMLFLMVRDFPMWGWLDHTKALSDCNELRNKGYWYPKRIIKTIPTQMFWAAIFILIQAVSIFLILILSFIFFR